MIILRLLNGVVDHFPIRRSEWVNSGVMIGWGLIIIFDGRPLEGAWYALGQVFGELVWALMFMIIGVLRLIALLANGTFPHSWYGRWSPHVRVAASLISALAWFQLVLASIYAPYLTTGLAAYLGFFVSDALNTLSSSAEARELDKGRRHAASRALNTR